MNIGTTHTFDSFGREVSLETGKLAKQADGSVVVKVGNTMLLATVVSNQEASPGVDFLPLTVDYREKFASTGKFPGGFIKREARPSETEVLTSRLIDRALRPLFPGDYHAETQVLVSLISSDQETMPDALACFAASAAITVSDIPMNGPVSEVRIGRVNGEFVVNPDLSVLKQSDIDMMVAGTLESIVMVEGEMDEVSEEVMQEAILKAHDAIKIQCQAQLDLAEKAGISPEKRTYDHKTHDEELEKKVLNDLYDDLYKIAGSGTGKNERYDMFQELKAKYLENFTKEELEEKSGLISTYFGRAKKEAVRNLILEKGERLDGRGTHDVRPIWSETGYLPGTHGSSIFTRGETQSLTTVTLGNKLNEQSVDGAFLSDSQSFMLHYNFPPFCTGEAKFLRGTSRREVGHGHLAQRALEQVLPEDYPYTVRVVSDILESNGSSSMATVCAGSLALMDAGVPIKKAVSGIAMGLILKGEEFAILSDILGDEDFLGDMDFKVAGTKDGITACQMDIKVSGLGKHILSKALEQAKAGRLHILNEMNKTISEPQAELKDNAPRIESMIIPGDMIGSVIGPGGKIIQEIQKETDTNIVIEEIDNKGHIDIMATNGDSMRKALARIKAITAVPEVGEEYLGKVKAIAPYGAFVEIIPGKDGLLHISEIEWRRIDKVEDVLKEGDEIKVKIIDIDQRSGKLKLSRKVLIPKPERD